MCRQYISLDREIRAADAVRALPEFAADEPEELLANLPKIIEALLGLDTSQAATGWLNQQAELSNPMLNPKLAVELQAAAPAAAGESGLFIEEESGRRFPPLAEGDALLHGFELAHGVRVRGDAGWVGVPI